MNNPDLKNRYSIEIIEDNGDFYIYSVLDGREHLLPLNEVEYMEKLYKQLGEILNSEYQKDQFPIDNE